MRSEPPVVAAVVIAVAASAGLVGLWHYATVTADLINPLILPAPDAVWAAFTSNVSEPYLGETLLGHALVSMAIVLGGWALGGLIGVPLGIAIGWSTRIRWVVLPVFQLLRPVPPLAWIPLAIVWLGIGDTARIFVVSLAALIPWAMNSIQAVSSVDPLLVKAARTLGAHDQTILTRVVVRAGLPTLVGGARIALGNAWMTLIAAELLAASAGLGYVTLNSSKTLDTDIMVAAMLVIGALGAVLSLSMQGLIRVLAPWVTRA